jgi:hypothetical protein
MAVERQFPLAPTRTRELEVGDFWAVQLDGGHHGCAQVTEVKRHGPGSRSTFIAGILAWRGLAAPTAEGIEGAAVLEQGLMRVEVFTTAGAVLLGNVEPRFDVPLDSNYRDYHVGAVHHVYGYRAFPVIVERVLGDAGVISPC